MTRHFAVVCLFAVAAHGQVGVPRAGCVLDRHGALRPVFGIAGVFIPGNAVQAGVISAACSDTLALVKTADELQVRDGQLRLLSRWPAPAGRDEFALPASGLPAFAYLAETRELMRIDGTRPPCAILDADSLGGDALSIANPDPQHLSAVIRGESGVKLVSLSLRNGAVTQGRALPEIAGPMMLRTDGTLIYGEGGEIVILRPGSPEQRFALPAPAASVYPMNGQLAEIALADGTAPAALRLEKGREAVLRVPEAAE